MKDYKPDLLVLLKLKYSVQLEFFICEIKKTGCTGDKYESDFAKIQRELKAIVNAQIELGVNDHVAYGILVEG
jgi:hypothetical protein